MYCSNKIRIHIYINCVDHSMLYDQILYLGNMLTTTMYTDIQVYRPASLQFLITLILSQYLLLAIKLQTSKKSKFEYIKFWMYNVFLSFIKWSSNFPLTRVVNISFCNSWVICHTTSEIREQMGNQLCAYRYKINLLQIKPSKIGPAMSF